MQSKDQNRLWVHLVHPLYEAPSRWYKFPRYTCLMALSYLREEREFLPANGAAKKEREMSHWDSSFYSTNNSVNTWHVPGFIVDPRSTMNKRNKFLQLMVLWWLLLANPILPAFPSLSPPGLLPSFPLDYPGWMSHSSLSCFPPTPGKYARASKSSHFFSLILHPLDLPAYSRAQRLWPVHLWTSGLA